MKNMPFFQTTYIPKKWALIALYIALTTSIAFSQSSQIVDKAKKATAYLIVEANNSQGSAFCISKKGYFITCAHVLGKAGIGAEVKLVLQSGTRHEKEIKARVTKKNDAMDLAVLTAINTPPNLLTPLPVSFSSKLKETQPVVVLGFPLGSLLAKEGGNPAVTIGTGKVTAIRRLENTIHRVQIDAKLNPGNSGGPVINHKGELIGIAVSKIVGFSSINFAIATEKLHTIMRAPSVEVPKITPIAFEDRKKQLVVPFSLNYLIQSKETPQIEAYIEGSASGKRKIKVIKNDKGYHAIGIPMPNTVKSASSILQVNFIRAGGGFRHTITMDVHDQIIKVGNQNVKLSDISMLFPTENIVRNHRGKDIRGPISGLEKMQEVDKNHPSHVFISNWQCIAFRPLNSVTEQVSLVIIVKDKVVTVTRKIPLPIVQISQDVINVGSVEKEPFNPVAGAQEIFEEPNKEIRLDGHIEDVTWGAGGRYLIARIKGKKKLIVVDCVKGTLIGEIPLESHDVVFSASAKYLLLAQGNKVSHWTFSPLQKVNKANVWTPGKILQLAVGAGAHHIAGVLYDALPPHGIYRFEFRNLKTGQLIAIEPRNSNLKPDMHFRASLSGHAYGAFTEALGSSGSNSVFYINQNQMAKTDFAGTGWICPDPVSQHCYTAWKGAQLVGYAPEKMSRSRSSSPGPFLSMTPTAITGIVNRLTLNTERNRQLITPYWSLFDARKNTFLIKNALKLDEFDTEKLEFEFNPQAQDPLTFDKRLFYNPYLGLLTTIPLTNRSIIIRRYDLWKQLQNKGAKYLFPLFSAPKVIASDQMFSLHLKMASSSNKLLKFEIIEAPEGVTISSTGLLQWQVGKHDTGNGHHLLIRITSQDGQSYLWQHQLFVR